MSGDRPAGRETFLECARSVQLTVSESTSAAAQAVRSGRADSSWDGGVSGLVATTEPAPGWDTDGLPGLPELADLRRRLGAGCRAAGIRDWVLRIVERTRRVTVECAGQAASTPVTDQTSHLVLRLAGRPARDGPRVVETASHVAALAEWDDRWLDELPAGLAAAADQLGRSRPWTGPQVLPVLFAAGTGGTIIHESVGHLLEADAPAGPRLGARVGSADVTVVDDATLPGLWGSRRSDDEGRACRPITLVERGRVTALLHSRATDPDGSASARRADYTSVPLPRMSNTYLGAGTDDPADLARGRAVLHCVRGGPAEVRPGSGEVLARIRHAVLLRHGEPVSAHSNLTLRFPADQLLYRIEGRGPDLRFQAAQCDKESQRIPVAHGAPTFRVPAVAVVS